MTSAELDALVAEATVDAYNDHEQITGLFTMPGRSGPQTIDPGGEGQGDRAPDAARDAGRGDASVVSRDGQARRGLSSIIQARSRFASGSKPEPEDCARLTRLRLHCAEN